MASIGYYDVFPEKWTTELRTATFLEGRRGDPIPAGTFLFTEYYCPDLKCSCQQVIVRVLHASSANAPPVEVATIIYSWNPNTDPKWAFLFSDLPNPFLNPFHRQAPFAPALLDFWCEMVEHDQAYVARLERHYHEIRAKIGRTENSWEATPVSNDGEQQRTFRRCTKQERTARKRLLARTRKR